MAVDTLHPTLAALGAEFAVLPESSDPWDVLCRFRDDSDESSLSARYGRIWPTPTGYKLDLGDVSVTVQYEPDGAVIDASINRISLRSRLPSHVRKITNMNYLDQDEINAKTLVYDVLDQVLQLVQLERRQTFVHASAISRAGKATLIGGWGGVGKTSSILSLVRDEGFQYLSDDLAVVDDAGMVYRSPKRLQIYPYNLSGDPIGESLLFKRRGPVDRLHWRARTKLRGEKHTRRRVSAEEFFGPAAVGTSAALSTFIHMERGAFETLTMHDTDPSKVAEQSASILVHELDPMTEIASASFASGSGPREAIGEWRQRSQSVIFSALQTARCYRLEVPLTASPSDLASVVHSVL